MRPVMKSFALFVGLWALVVVSEGCGGGNASNVSTGGNTPVAAMVADSVATPLSPLAIGVDSSTNKIYVLNRGTASMACGANPGNVTVIDGTTDISATISAGFQPVAVTVDDANHTAYVVSRPLFNINNGSCGIVPPALTIIDGVALTHSIVDLSFTYFTPTALVVNPLTDKVYLTAACCNNVIGVIDGATNSVTPVSDPSAVLPNALAANSTTNNIYVANSGSNSVSVMDGATNSVSTVADPNATAPNAVAVNSMTNKIYVANKGSNNISVIDGATNSVTTLADPNAMAPVAVAVNPTTNTIYVANSKSNNLTVIDGATGSITATVAVGTSPSGIAVDEKTNFIYIANAGNTQNPGNVTVINGATNATTTLSDPKAVSPVAIAADSATNKIYVANSGSNNVTVIDGAH